MKNLLEVSNLTKRYDRFTLDKVSFALPGGSIMGFIGENGAGKTTTLKLILGLIRRDGGDITLLGRRQSGDDRTIKEQLGVVMDEGFFSEYLSPKDIATTLRHLYKSWDDAAYARWLERFGLPAQKMVKTFSKGMRTKLALASALSHHPRLLLLDEATSGLDPVVRSEVLDVFLEFIQDEEHSILLSSHITSDLEQVADYITFIHKGRLLLSDTKDRLLEHYGVVRCGADDFARIDSAILIGSRKNRFGYEALVADRASFQRTYSGLVVDPAKLEDMMLYYIKGEKQ